MRTRPFGEMVDCPQCGHRHTKETAFERWMRNEEELDSGLGLVRFDLDVLLHRYMRLVDGKGSRDLQIMMFIEVKTLGANVLQSQLDTFSLLSQVLRNRKTNMHQQRHGRHTDAVTPVTAHSKKLGKPVTLWLRGGHLLQLSGTSPVNSSDIRWDWKKISIDDLVGLIRFDLDPDTLKPIDWRRRYADFVHSKKRQQLLSFGESA
jgi:hypothetical protein